MLKIPSATSKQYIVLLLRPDLPISMLTPSASDKLQEKGSNNFPQGYFIAPKSKRGQEDEYFSGGGSRKGSGTVNIKLPRRASAAGMSYEVLGIEHREFLSICNCKIKIDQVGLLEDDSNAAYSKTVQQLLDLKSKGNKYPPALDPVKGMLLKFCILILIQSIMVYNPLPFALVTG